MTPLDPILLAGVLQLAANLVKAVEGYAKGDISADELGALFRASQDAHDELQAAIAKRKEQGQ